MKFLRILGNDLLQKIQTMVIFFIGAITTTMLILVPCVTMLVGKLGLNVLPKPMCVPAAIWHYIHIGVNPTRHAISIFFGPVKSA